jgi:hypothetical protein
MRNIIAAVLLIAAVALGLNGIRQDQGPKPEVPCKACVTQGPKPDVPCRACIAQRNQAIIDADLTRNHVAHVGGVPVM